MKNLEQTCCDNEANFYDDENEDVLCNQCDEHACPVKCKECGETIFQSNCCA